MPKADQSLRRRIERLQECRCPVHGTALLQTGLAGHDRSVYVAECPRSDCSIQAFALHPDGPAMLAYDSANLLNPPWTY